MPELPEVETIVRQLQGKVLGKHISKVEIVNSSFNFGSIKKSEGNFIESIYRRAKNLVFVLSNGDNVVTALRMTGHFRYKDKNGTVDDPYEVGRLVFSDGSILSHHSIRKFGSVEFMSGEDMEKKFSKLGYEPLSMEFTLDKYKELMLKKNRSNIKNVLMDQYCIVGIGNIYAQEALFHAGIDPRHKVGDVSSNKLERLHSEIIRVLQLAISQNGTTVENYSNLEGAGGYQNELVVYGKDECPLGHEVTKIKQGGRGTRFCEECQS
jgi:formamidopyrimidine-DNA glycosylase